VRRRRLRSVTRDLRVPQNRGVTPFVSQTHGQLKTVIPLSWPDARMPLPPETVSKEIRKKKAVVHHNGLKEVCDRLLPAAENTPNSNQSTQAKQRRQGGFRDGDGVGVHE